MPRISIRLIPLLASGELDESWCLVTDDIFPSDLRRNGHLDGLLRRVVAGGVPPAVAVRHASYIPARHYGLRDRGALAPGCRADVVLVEDLQEFPGAHRDQGRPRAAARWPMRGAGPRPVVRSCEYGASAAALRGDVPSARGRRELSGDRDRSGSDRHPAQSSQRAQAGRRSWAFDPERDVLLIANIERHKASGRIGLGLVSGFGLTRDGALGSSVAHDSHNLIIAGTNAADMLVCAGCWRSTAAASWRRQRGRAGRRAAAGRRVALARARGDGLPPARRGQSGRRGAGMPARGSVRYALVPGPSGHSGIANHDAEASSTWDDSEFITL